MMGKFYLAMGMSVAASAVGFMFLFWDFWLIFLITWINFYIVFLF